MGDRNLLCLLLTLLLVSFSNVDCLGCIRQICSSNPQNKIRQCPDADGTCGNYHGMRFGNRLVDGVDLLCAEGSQVFAPFSGQISFHSPFGDHSCTDQGVKIAGEGQWQGYYAVISFVKPYRTGGRVEKGDAIGEALSHECRTGVFERHILFELYKRGRPIDPTYHVKDCFCTGQVCDTNNNNELKAEPNLPWKTLPEFGKGFELKCPDTKNEFLDTNGIPSRTPLILSPITGKRYGRFRLKSDHPSACLNDGVFVIGSEDWEDFTVHIYNAQFVGRPGIRPIEQGDVIAKRLNCEGQQIDSVFMEIRFRGRHVNVTDMILGTKCQKPEM